jgi:hypothetical protein
VVNRLELACGKAPWLTRSYWVVLIFTTVLLLAADTSAVWRLGSVALLLMAVMLGRLLDRRRNASGRMVLDREGHVDFLSAESRTAGRLSGAPWVTPWVCILHWRPLRGGWPRHSMVCRSMNRPDDYRRLRVWLRLAPGAANGAHA